MATRPEGYRSRVAPQAGAPMPLARPDAYGAGVADSVRQLAGTVHAERVEDKRIEKHLERNRQWTEFQTSFAKAREEMADLSRETRQAFTPEHADGLGKAWQEREQALLDTIEDREVRQRAQASLSTWGVSFRDGEKDWATVRAGELAVENHREARDASANRVRRLEKPEDYAGELLVQMEAIDGLEASDKVKDALREETEQVMAVAYLQGRIDEDPRLAKAMLDSGAFDEMLTPNQVEALLNGADVEIRRADAAAVHVANQAKAELRQDMGLLREETGQGLDRADKLPELRQRAEALGMAEVVAEIDGMAADNVFARVYEGSPPVQLEQRMATLRGQDNRSDQQNRELKWLEDKLPAISSRYNDDPVGFYARESEAGAPPALDFEDPATIAARSRWAAAASQTSGRPVPVLSRAEAQQLASNYESGRAGEEAVLSLLHRLPAAQAMQAARMVDPSDRTLPIIVTLPQQYRNAARRGREALKASPKLITDQLKDSLDLEEAVTDQTRRAELALIGFEGDQRGAIFETAQQIAAGFMDKLGAPMTEQLWRLSLDMALGAEGKGADRKGGFASWGERWFLLPQGVKERDFRIEVQATLARSDRPPVNPDGSPANISRAYPVAVGHGLYEFRTNSGQQYRTSDGAVWRVRVKPR